MKRLRDVAQYGTDGRASPSAASLHDSDDPTLIFDVKKLRLDSQVALPGELRLKRDVCELLAVGGVRVVARGPLTLDVELFCSSGVPLVSISVVVEKFFPHVVPGVFAQVVPWQGVFRANVQAAAAADIALSLGRGESARSRILQACASGAPDSSADTMDGGSLPPIIFDIGAPIALRILAQWSPVFSLCDIVDELRGAALQAAQGIDESRAGMIDS